MLQGTIICFKGFSLSIRDQFYSTGWENQSRTPSTEEETLPVLVHCFPIMLLICDKRLTPLMGMRKGAI